MPAGNALDPWRILDTHGADALRWLLLVDGNPWQPRRVGDEALREVTRKVDGDHLQSETLA